MRFDSRLRASSSSKSKAPFDCENEPGVIAPTGFWDPFQLANGIDEETFTKYRTAELKHARIAMLAITGLIVQNYYQLPGGVGNDLSQKFTDIPNGVAAISALPYLGWVQIFFSIGVWDLAVWKQKDGSTPGDFGWDALASLDDPDAAKEMKTKELQNGRIAMIAIIELLVHNVVCPSKALFDLSFV